MADHNLEFRISIEYSSEDEADDVDRGLDVPSPTGTREHVSYDWRETTIRCLNHRLRGFCGVEIDRDSQRCSALEDWPEKFVIEIASTVMTVDDRSFEAMVADHPFQFFGSPVWRRGWKRGKSSKSVRVPFDCIGKK